MSERTLLYLVQNDWFFVSHRLPLAREAMRRGWRVVVAARMGETADRLESEGVVLAPLRHLDVSNMNPFRELITVAEIASVIRRVRPEILHTISLRPVLHGGLLSRWLGVPALVSAVTGLGHLFTDASLKNRLVREMMVSGVRHGHNRPATRVIFQNRDDQGLFLKRSIIQHQQARLIPGSGVDLDTFRPRNGKTPREAPTVLFGGRMLYSKGVGVLVDAARILMERNVPGQIVLVGEPDSGNPAAVKQADLESWQNLDNVEWLGKRPDMPELLADADIACLPSGYGEGIPKYLIEATACGLPIVTTDAPGCRETVPDGRNGILVPVQDAKSLADALQQLLTDARLRMTMGKESRALAERSFSIENVLEQHFRIYDEVLIEAGLPITSSTG
jgi:glycosyltransferase involved in cell wall biosynthesis